MTTCVFDFFVKLTERCQHATPHLFCVKEVTRQQGNTATTAETSFFLACLCAVKVAELWDRLTWFAWTVFCFLKTTSWTLTQVGLEVSKIRLPSTIPLGQAYENDSGTKLHPRPRMLYPMLLPGGYDQATSQCVG